MGNVKKSVAERTRHKKQYDRRMKERQMQSRESKVVSSKALDASLVVIECSGTKSDKHITSSGLGTHITQVVDADITQVNDQVPSVEYLQHEHYALWEVIEFGDSYKAPPEETAKDKGPAGKVSSSTKKKGRTVAITAKDMQKRKNDVKARTTLLLALPDEYHHQKEKKNQLKQHYGNFKAEGSETLKQTFNRLQDIVSHLEFIDVPIEQDDLNQKFLTSLAPEWLVYTIV
nr:hypothetical protein [Tanacetum cinerariifolium]